jgi:hypothetical protein
MRDSFNIAIIKTILVPMLLMFFYISSCSGAEYTTQHFSFPLGTKPHDNNWQYLGMVVVSSAKSGPITQKSTKKVKIKISGKNEQIYLEDNFEFISASIRAKVTWNNFDYIEVELMEVGNKFAKDPYNAQLIKSGPRNLRSLVYKYDGELKKFQRVKL